MRNPGQNVLNARGVEREHEGGNLLGGVEFNPLGGAGAGGHEHNANNEEPLDPDANDHRGRNNNNNNDDNNNNHHYENRVNLYKSLDIILARKRAKTPSKRPVFSDARYQDWAFHAVEKGHHEWLRVLLYDGLTFEREIIAAFDQQGSDYLLKSEVLHFKNNLLNGLYSMVFDKRNGNLRNLSLEALRSELNGKAKTILEDAERRFEAILQGKDSFWCYETYLDFQEEPILLKSVLFHFKQKCVAYQEELMMWVQDRLGNGWEVAHHRYQILTDVYNILNDKITLVSNEQRRDSEVNNEFHRDSIDQYNNAKNKIEQSEGSKRETIRIWLAEAPRQLPERCVDKYREINDEAREALIEEIASCNVDINVRRAGIENTLLHAAVDKYWMLMLSNQKEDTHEILSVMEILLERGATPFEMNANKKIAIVDLFNCAMKTTHPKDPALMTLIRQVEQWTLDRFLSHQLVELCDPLLKVKLEDVVSQMLNILSDRLKELRDRVGYSGVRQWIATLADIGLLEGVKELAEFYRQFIQAAGSANIFSLRDYFKGRSDRDHFVRRGIHEKIDRIVGKAIFNTRELELIRHGLGDEREGNLEKVNELVMAYCKHTEAELKKLKESLEEKEQELNGARQGQQPNAAPEGQQEQLAQVREQLAQTQGALAQTQGDLAQTQGELALQREAHDRELTQTRGDLALQREAHDRELTQMRGEMQRELAEMSALLMQRMEERMGLREEAALPPRVDPVAVEGAERRDEEAEAGVVEEAGEVVDRGQVNGAGDLLGLHQNRFGLLAGDANKGNANEHMVEGEEGAVGGQQPV